MPKDILPNLRLADVAEFSTASTGRTESHGFNAPPGQSDHVSACEGGVPLIGENASLGNGASLASNCVNYYQMTSPDVEIPRDGSAGSAAVPTYVQVTEGTPASSGTDFGVTPNGVLNSSSSNRIENEGPFQGQGESAQTENSHPQTAFQNLVSPLQYEHRPPFVEETYLDGQGLVGQPSWSNNNQHLGQNDNGPAHASGDLSSPVKTNSQQQMSFDSNSAQQQGTFQESNSHHSLHQVVENSQEQFGVSSVLNQFGLGPPKENHQQMVEMSQSVSVDAHQFGGNLTSANPQQNNAFQLSSIVNPLPQNTVQQGNFGQTPSNSSSTFPSQNALFHQASSNFVQLDIMETTVQHLNMSPQDQMAYNSEYPQLNPATEQHMSRMQAEEKTNENHQTNIIEQKKEPTSQLPVTLEQQFSQNENQQAHQVDLVADHHSPHISDHHQESMNSHQQVNIETSPQQFDVFPHLQTKTDQQVQSNYAQQSEENLNPHYVATTDQTGDHLNNQQQNNTYTQQQINVNVNTILSNQHNNLNPQIGFNASKQLNNETMDQANVFWEQPSNINTFQQIGTVNQPEFNNPPTDISPVRQTNHQQQSNAQHSHDQLHLNLLQQLLSNSEHDVSSAKPGDSNASLQVITGASSPGEGMNGQQMFPNLNVQVDQSVVNGKSAPESPVGVAEQCVSATQLSPVGNLQTIGNVQSTFSTLPTSSGNLFSINQTQPGDSFAAPPQPFSTAQQLSFDNFKGSDSSAQQTYNEQQTVTSTGQLSVSDQQPITVSTAIVHPSGFPTDLPAGFNFAQNPEEKIRLSPSSESLAAGLLQMLSTPGNDFSSASDLATQVKQARYAPNEKDQSLNRPATSEDLSFQSLQPSEQDLLYETIDSLVAQNDGKTEHIQNKDTVRNFQQIGDDLRNSEPTPISSFGQVDSAKDSLSFEGLGKRSFDASTDESNQVNFNTPVKNFPTLFQFTEPQMQSPRMGQTTAFGLQIPSTVQSMNADGVDSHHVSRSTSGQTSPSNIDSSHCTGDESNGQSSPSHSTSRNRCHLKRLAEDLPRRLRLHIQSNLESENSSSSHSSVTSPTQSNHIPMEHDNASQASLVALSEQLNIEHARKAVPSSITTGNNRPDFDEETMFNITSRPNDNLLPSVTTDADSGSTPTMSFASIRKATPVSESFVPRCSDMLDTGISSVSITDDSNDGVFRRPALEPARYKKMPGRAKKMREASLTQQFAASANGYQLQIIEQPEDQHRARYKTEGSRGSVKDRSQQGHPAVKLVGMNEPVTLQVFVGNDTGKVKPHGFYQACKVCGKTSTPCFEKDIEGTTVIELQMDPSTDMIARIDCVGILKLRNADVEQRMGLAKAKKKSLKARLVFRVTFKRPDGCFQTLQVSSHPILCTQPIGCPEISKKSLSESSVEGGEELFIIGKNFMKGTKVLFQQLGENGKTIWEAEGEIDKDYFQNTHLICTVPAYHDLLITSPVTAQVVVRCSGKPSYPLPFTYMPKVKQERMEVDPGLQQLVNGKAAPDALKLNEMIVPSAEGMFKLRPDVAMSILAENKGMKMETDQNQKACAATVVSLPGSQIATSPFIQQAPILLSNSQSAVGISLPSPQPLSSAGVETLLQMSTQSSQQL